MEAARRVLPERIEGDGVALRRWRVADAEALERAVTESRDHLRPWMAFMAQEPQTLDQRRKMLERREREWSEGGDVLLGILLDDEVVAGSCGLHRRRGLAVLEIGYWLHPTFTGRGLATLVARLLTDAAFSVPGITRVEIHTDKANSASAGVPRRLGFHYLGESPDVAAAPAMMGVDCAWLMERERWRRDGAAT